jgi:hypothetical protein
MKNISQLFTGAALTVGLFAATQTAAQTTVGVGPRLGLNIASFNLNKESIDVTSRKGVQAGVMLNVRFGRLSFQPALMYSQRGGDVFEKDARYGAVFANIKEVYRFDFVDLPLNLVYTTSKDHGFQTILGPYASWGVGGTASQTVITQPSQLTPSATYYNSDAVSFKNNVGSTDPPGTYVRALDIGAQVGLGYLYKHVQLQAIYQIGLSRIEPDWGGQEKSEDYHRVLQFTLSYVFQDDVEEEE